MTPLDTQTDLSHDIDSPADAPARRGGMDQIRIRGGVPLKGQIPVGFVVFKAGVNRPPEEVEKECVQLVREKIGAVAALRIVMNVARLPKTRSGKILRGTIRKIADGEDWNMPATIDDPAILDEITTALSGRGLVS